MLLRHNTGAWIRQPPFTRCDCWLAHDIVVNDEYGVAEWGSCHRLVDIGASIGLVGFKTRLHYPDAQIVCAEPMRENFEALKQNVPDATVLEAAVCYDRETVEMYAPEHEIRGPIQLSTGITADRTFHRNNILCHVVPAITIERVMEAMGWKSADVLKMDCEMCEFSVLERPSVLKMFRIVVGEYHDKARMDAVMEPLHSQGFTVIASGGDRWGKFVVTKC